MYMSVIYNESAPKKATNLTINADLLKKAKELKINLSKSFETFLDSLIREREEKKWHEENRSAVDEYNDRIEKKGAFSDTIRSF